MGTAGDKAALRLNDLTVLTDSDEPIVEGVSLEVGSGQVLGVVGESGSGKTTVALSLLGYARSGMKIAGGSLEISGQRADLLDRGAMRPLRGQVVSYVPQDPSASLNPALRIRSAIGDVLRAHSKEAARDDAVLASLERVRLPATDEFAHRYPHQLSGGQQQRVTIASSTICEPPVVVLDEPTTGLDVVTQAAMLRELKRLQRERGLSMIYVSHDLAVVAEIADRVAVMYGGRIVEEGLAAGVLAAPRHPYTRGLVGSIPDHAVPRLPHGMQGAPLEGGEARPPGCLFAPRCPQRIARCEEARPPLEPVDAGHVVACIEHERTPPVDYGEALTAQKIEAADLLVVDGLRATHGSGPNTVVAANDIGFRVRAGECLALVGESGSGKSTIARCVAGLHVPAAGRIVFDGADVPGKARDRSRETRRRIQLIFQNPYASLNPRHRVEESVARPSQVLRGLSVKQSLAESVKLLELVHLPSRVGRRFPAELSGGERQRVAIARALAAGPDLIICDEITSALDVSVQATVLELLAELRQDRDLSLLFITHDLGVVAAIADSVLVLQSGCLRERGPTARILREPGHEYTKQLLDSAPRLAHAAA
ncbi:MAG: ABC transporter ATP-binding protein [Solirubrobacterales bacterium]